MVNKQQISDISQLEHGDILLIIKRQYKTTGGIPSANFRRLAAVNFPAMGTDTVKVVKPDGLLSNDNQYSAIEVAEKINDIDNGITLTARQKINNNVLNSHKIIRMPALYTFDALKPGDFDLGQIARDKMDFFIDVADVVNNDKKNIRYAFALSWAEYRMKENHRKMYSMAINYLLKNKPQLKNFIL